MPPGAAPRNSNRVGSSSRLAIRFAAAGHGLGLTQAGAAHHSARTSTDRRSAGTAQGRGRTPARAGSSSPESGHLGVGMAGKKGHNGGATPSGPTPGTTAPWEWQKVLCAGCRWQTSAPKRTRLGEPPLGM